MKYSYQKFFTTLLILLFIIFPPTKLYAQASNTYDKIIFFGDSLTDNGNLYAVDLGILPKSPPYYHGRFSNNVVWSEILSQYYYDKYHISSDNYAVGGETTVFHNPIGGFLPYVLKESVDHYLLHYAFKDKSHTLFIIWIGANDYLTGAKDEDQITTQVTQEIKHQIERLIASGGKYFLILNLPNLSKTPFGIASSIEKNLNDLTLLHNRKLQNIILELQQEHKDLNFPLYDINALFTILVEHTDVFNDLYQTHITHVATACWAGGYTVKQLRTPIQLNVPVTMDTQKFANYVAATPALAVAYHVGESYTQGVMPCANPDEYAFWDHVHPSAIVHKTLSTILIDYVEQTKR